MYRVKVKETLECESEMFQSKNTYKEYMEEGTHGGRVEEGGYS